MCALARHGPQLHPPGLRDWHLQQPEARLEGNAVCRLLSRVAEVVAHHERAGRNPPKPVRMQMRQLHREPIRIALHAIRPRPRRFERICGGVTRDPQSVLQHVPGIAIGCRLELYPRTGPHAADARKRPVLGGANIQLWTCNSNNRNQSFTAIDMQSARPNAQRPLPTGRLAFAVWDAFSISLHLCA
jgi:hypothetical protein